MTTAAFRIFGLLGSAAFSLAIVGAASAAQLDPQGGSQDVEKVVWTVAGVVVASLAMGILYLFKRRVGGFPKNPSWVAPISVMPASELPDETDDSQAAGGHAAAGHAPAH